MNTLDAKGLIEALYSAVDNKDVSYLDEMLADNVQFRIGNNPAITDKATALEANKGFFQSIESMTHQIDDVWALGDDIICKGAVDYIRLDGSDYSAYFSTFLKIVDNEIAEYFVYVDVSNL